MEIYDQSAGYGDIMPVGSGVVPGTTNAVDPSSAWPIAGSTGMAYGFGTSQQGISPAIGPMTGANAIVEVWNWLNRPFTQPMSPVTLTLMVGVILVAILFWNFILYHIRIAAETI